MSAMSGTDKSGDYLLGVERGAPMFLDRNDSAEVSVLSWNVLADCYFQSRRANYADFLAADSPMWDWQTRSDRLIDEVLQADPAVLCLQEVEFEAFDSTFMRRLSSAGYDGIMQRGKSRSGGGGGTRRCGPHGY